MSRGNRYDPKALFGVVLAFMLVSVLTFILALGGRSRSARNGEAAGAGSDSAPEAQAAVHIRLAAGDLLNYDRPITEVLGGGRFDKGKISLYVEKSQFRLTVLYDGTPVKQYPVCFGGNTEDKLMQGDGCVPEGRFVIRELYPHQSWSRFLWIDYPNQDSWRKYNAAKTEGRIPQDTAIGGEVGIHGTQEGEDYLILQGINYTAGCVGMLRSDVEEVFNVCRTGTPILIVP
jgi:hypothetical protein